MVPKNILITGSNRGIGLEFVKQILALKPTILIATCRNPDAATELKELQKCNANLHILRHDMSSIEDQSRIAVEATNILKGDGLNMLINNAGINERQESIFDVTADVMMAGYMINCVGPTLLIQCLLPLLEKAATDNESAPVGWNRAIVVNISSMLGSIGKNIDGGTYDYRPTKTALNMITKNVSLELAPKKILCVVLHPGHVSTDMGKTNPLYKPPTGAYESVSGMLKVLDSLTEGDQSTFKDFKNEVLPW